MPGKSSEAARGGVCVMTAAFPFPSIEVMGTERAVDTNLASEDKATLRSDLSAEARGGPGWAGSLWSCLSSCAGGRVADASPSRGPTKAINLSNRAARRSRPPVAPSINYRAHQAIDYRERSHSC